MKKDEDMIFGVCGTIANELDVKVGMVRLFFIFFFVLMPVRSLLFYLVAELAFVTPESIDKAIKKKEEMKEVRRQKAAEKKELEKEIKKQVDSWDVDLIDLEEKPEIEYNQENNMMNFNEKEGSVKELKSTKLNSLAELDSENSDKKPKRNRI